MFLMLEEAKPFSTTGAVWTAGIAAVGYLGNLIVTSSLKRRETDLARKASLMKLGALLNTMHVAYRVQLKHRGSLRASLELRVGSLPKPHEDFFTFHYDEMTLDERELHALIRGITIHSLKPMNEKARKWLADDTFFRSQRRTFAQRKLGEALNQLDSHVWTWMAKYECSIPKYRKHALVYMADENRYGVGFPIGIEALIEAVGREPTWWEETFNDSEG